MARLNTALEMHIEVLQGLQKIDSYRQDMFLPHEIDFHLNKQQDVFIHKLFSKDFEDIQAKLDYVRTLVEKNKKLQVFAPEVSDVLYEPFMGYAVLPPNYMYLVNDRSKAVKSLAFCRDLTEKITYPAFSEHVAVLPFPDSGLSQGPFYNGLEITKFENGAYTVLYSLPSAFENYFYDKEARFMIINNSLEVFNRSSILTKVYWEEYRGAYYKNSYVFVRPDGDWDHVKAEIFTSGGTPTLDASTTSTFTENVYRTIDLNVVDADKKIIYADNAMTEGDKRYDLEKNSYYKTTAQEPTSVMAGDLLYVYFDKSFIITEVAIDYVRKPRQISLALSQSCELPSGSAKSEIVDKTVEYLKLAIENPSYKEFMQANIIKNQNI